MEKTESQKKLSQEKFGEFLLHIKKYLDNIGIVPKVTVELSHDDSNDMKKKVTKSVSFGFYKREQHENTTPLAILHCYCTINDTIAPYYTRMNYSGCVTRSQSNISREPMPDIEANTLSIIWVGVLEEAQGKGYGLLILIYCICHINAENNFDYFNLDDDSKAANSVGKNIYRKVGFIPLPGEFINLDSDNPKMYESTGGPELFVPLQCYEGDEYEHMIGRLVFKKFPLRDIPANDIYLTLSEKSELELLDEVVTKTSLLNSWWKTLLKAKLILMAPLSKPGGPMRVKITTSRTTPYSTGGSAAKYTLKELKDIAVSNKIKITKKIDNKTLYLNKADLIKKLKKHKLL